MIVVMSATASVVQISSVIRKVEELGFKPFPSRGAEQTVIGVIGTNQPAALVDIGAMPGVAQILPISKKFKLVNREFKPEPTVIRAAGVPIGGEEFIVMAGPCAVESRPQLQETARAVAACGGRILRGGAFKPRTSPYSFQGLGEEGLQILFDAKQETGLPVITEVMTPNKVELVARYADILQIGTRNMQNYALLEAAGQARKPVLLKRGMMSTIEEMLLAAEYILSNGNAQVMFCERGIRTFEKATRNTLDLSAIPVIKSQSHLSVIVDPSHATGRKDCIAAMARASLAAGADGIIVEVHPRPEEALSDGPQSLTFPEFAELMDQLRPLAAAMGRSMKDATDFPGSDDQQIRSGNA
ncbi:MAG: 3-deoxy-7-phosphoheptulonate synthase [bacterium]